MSHLEKLEKLIEIAQQLGYKIRYDYFGGTGGGVCEFGGKRWLFIDLALSNAEQLELVAETIADEPLLNTFDLDGDVAATIRHAA